MRELTRDGYRLDDVEAVEELKKIYGITYSWFDEETGEFVYSEPVTWIYDDGYYEIKPEDYN